MPECKGTTDILGINTYKSIELGIQPLTKAIHQEIIQDVQVGMYKHCPTIYSLSAFVFTYELLLTYNQSQKKSIDVVTLFHKKSSPASTKVLGFLQETNVRAATAAASEKPSEDKITEFELDVVEDPPTPDQLSNILEYVGQSNAGKVIQGASDATNAMKIFRSDAQSFQRPVVCLSLPIEPQLC